MKWKIQVYDKIGKLRQHAIKCEKENSRAFDRLGLDKKAKEIVADNQYWNGYLDGMSNIEKEIKKLN